MTLRRGGDHALTGWIAYTYTRARRRDHPGEPQRPFDYDQPHVLTAVADWTRGGWTVGARFRLASGLPRTPVTGAYYEARLDRWEPEFGPVDSIRLPTFVEVDLRGERRFGRVSAYLEVENATDHHNVEEYVYSYDYRSREDLTGLPLLAIAGVEARL